MNNCNNTPNQGLKAAYDPGWNDPPSLTYNGQQTTPNRPRNFLNKRVAFPLSKNSPDSGSTLPVNLPSIPTIPCTPSILPMTDKTDETIDINSEETLREVKEILMEFLENSSELGSKSNDIKRRIDVMEDMWSSGKLNIKVQVKMKELAIALKEDKPSVADDIHRGLMVDYVSAVGIWMPGVKQLVHHCIARSELMAIDKQD